MQNWLSLRSSSVTVPPQILPDVAEEQTVPMEVEPVEAESIDFTIEGDEVVLPKKRRILKAATRTNVRRKKGSREISSAAGPSRSNVAQQPATSGTGETTAAEPQMEPLAVGTHRMVLRKRRLPSPFEEKVPQRKKLRK